MQQPGFGTARFPVESDSLGFDASWEIDLFGHVRRSVEAARADLGAEQANLRDAEVTVAAEVARNYFELRGAQKRLDVARRNLGSEQQSRELTQLRDEAGRGDGTRRGAQPRAPQGHRGHDSAARGGREAGELPARGAAGRAARCAR